MQFINIANFNYHLIVHNIINNLKHENSRPGKPGKVRTFFM